MKRHNLRELRKAQKRIADEFPEAHPARIYLLRHYEVKREVCGRDLSWPDRPAVDLGWSSALMARRMTFSAFAYMFISRDVFLIEWFDPDFVAAPSPAEIEAITGLSFKLVLLEECRSAAQLLNRHEIIRFVELAQSTFSLELLAIASRLNTSPDQLRQLYGKTATEYATRFASGKFGIVAPSSIEY
jgi:hypothetical protein